jgi:hypothetical protein
VTVYGVDRTTTADEPVWYPPAPPPPPLSQPPPPPPPATTRYSTKLDGTIVIPLLAELLALLPAAFVAYTVNV